MIKRIYRIFKRDGIRLFLVKLIAKSLAVDIGVRKLKNEVWSILLKKYNYKVAYGPFKGMTLAKKMWWGNDWITQTLGIYEEHLFEYLEKFSQLGAKKFIDIGAADGYFVIGLTFSKIYEKSIAFEISHEGRKSIHESARRNRCEDRVEIYSEANLKSLTAALSGSEKSTVMIDIEGAEYDFLSDEILKTLSNSFVICELHHNLVNNGSSLELGLLSRADKYFNTQLIKRENYNPNAFPDLDHLGDDKRLIAVSEGRSKNTRWLVCSPTETN